MLKYGKIAHDIILEKLERSGVTKERKVNNCITNKYISLVLKMEELSDGKALGVLTRDFNESELVEYSKTYLKKEITDGFTVEHIRRISQKVGLNTYERRAEYRKRVEDLTEVLLRLIDGSKEAYQEYIDKYAKYAFDSQDVENKGMHKYITLGVVTALSKNTQNPIPLKNIDKSYIKSIDSQVARYMLSDIQYEVACELELRKRRKDTAELINSFKEIVSETAEGEIEEAEGYQETIESVKLERDQYKSSLSQIQKSLDELSENVRKETEMIAAEKIRDFFIALNSSRYGNFLDKIPLTEELLNEIRKDENYSQLPQNIKKVLIFIKSVIKFIKDQDIEPIEEINKVFEVRAEDIAKMYYQGEEFLSDEVKVVKVVAPGYKYNGLVISIPKVEEVR